MSYLDGVPFHAPLPCFPVPNLAILASLCLAGGQAAAAPPDDIHPLPKTPAAAVDFARDIEPLLALRCWKCHQDLKREGGLSLTSREFAKRGGESGLNPLEKGAENELLRRIRSTDPNERMPLEGSALTAGEIDLLSRWIEAGAPWPTAHSSGVPKPTERRDPSAPRGWLGSLLDWWDRAGLGWIRPAVWSLLGVLAVILILERIKARSRPAGASVFARIAGTPRSLYLAGLLGTAIYELSLYANSLHGELQRAQWAHAQTRSELNQLRLAEAERLEQIYWPKHPPRLGGTYYRGNDERYERLYNGGVYRTATLELRLLDSGGQVLQPGDRASGPVELRLTIRWAKNTTPQLFGHTLGQVCLSPTAPVKRTGGTASPAKNVAGQNAERMEPSPKEAGPYMVQTLEPGEAWEVKAPLPEPFEGEPLTGMLYLYVRPPVPDDEVANPPHYAISWLELDGEQRLTKASTLHLGAALIAPPVVRIPEGRMEPSEWLDYRPLPEIEGEPTTDPKLLGVEEHLKP